MTQITSRLLFLVAVVFATALTSHNRPLSAAETSLSKLAQHTHFHGVTVDAADSSRLLLATHHGLFSVTRDGGATRISLDGNDYMGFTPHPSDAKVLYGSGHPAGGGNMGFITSTNGGKTWTKLSNGVGGPVDFHQMDVSKADPNVMFGNSRGLQTSRDGGHSWAKIGPPPDGLIDIAASAKDINTLYAATQRGLVRSTDGGRSWQPAHILRRTSTMVHVTHDADVYVFQLGTGLLRTSEPNLNWQLVSNEFDGVYVLHLAVDPANSKALYAVTLNSKTRAQAILTSRDGGKTWNELGGK